MSLVYVKKKKKITHTPYIYEEELREKIREEKRILFG
jgi:hypothetical protein